MALRIIETTEFKLRHILVKEEAEAATIITELDSGADFAELAKTKSTGPLKTQGGDLGWFSATLTVAPFPEAVAQLEKGSYTKIPVKTQFGYHVIYLEDIRYEPMHFEKVEDKIKWILGFPKN